MKETNSVKVEIELAPDVMEAAEKEAAAEGFKNVNGLLEMIVDGYFSCNSDC